MAHAGEYDDTALKCARQFFDGQNLADKSQLAAYLVTVDPHDWPHAAMISVGEMLVLPDSSARLALWRGSRTTANLRRTGRAVLLVVWQGQALRLRLDLHELPGPPAGAMLAYFAGHVAGASADRAPYATLTHGVRIALHDQPGTLARWRDTLGVLRRLDPGRQ